LDKDAKDKVQLEQDLKNMENPFGFLDVMREHHIIDDEEEEEEEKGGV